MLAELLEWFLTPCPPAARRLGYLHEAIAIRARYRRHQHLWQPHLQATRAFVERAALATTSKKCAVVLGSGALYDVPIELLAEAYDRVELVDLVHPREARRAASRLRNVKLRTEDISGAVATLGDLERNTETTPILAPPLAFSKETDFVLSANLLSQLPEIPYNWLTNRTIVPEPACRNFGAAIVRRHLNLLSNCDCPVALVTDVERCYVEPDGSLQAAWDSLYGFTLPQGKGSWYWEVAPPGEVHPDLAVRMTVRAFDYFEGTQLA